ncbi:MAG: tRNA (adenosine(37)-N6)-threonylcarbamoyltransferase complex dimerization subunit type 1 TsaB [Rhodospirillales bacterium]
MTRILAVDTTAEFGSIALVEGGETVSEELIHAPEGFGQVLFGRLDALLARAGWKLDEIDCFAAAAGPGSFTGVRIGLAAVKGLAEALKRPAVAVSNLQAVASFGSAPLRAAVLDARRGQIYGAVYDAALAAVTPEVVTSLPQWLASLPEGELEFVSTDFAPFRGALAGTRFEKAPVRHAPRALAGAIGRIAAERLAAGAAHDPAALDANYVRRSDAEMFWKE